MFKHLRFGVRVAGEEGGAPTVGRPPPSSPAGVSRGDDGEEKLSCRATLSVGLKRKKESEQMKDFIPFFFLNGAESGRMCAKWRRVGRPRLG